MNAKGSETHRIIWAMDKTRASTTAATVLQSTAWIDMQNWGRCLVVLFRLSGTGNLKAATGVSASAASTGTSSASITTLGSTYAATGRLTCAIGTILAPGIGTAIFDVAAEQVENAVAGGRYISAILAKATKGDQIGCCYILLDPKNRKSGNLTTGGSKRSSTLTHG